MTQNGQKSFSFLNTGPLTLVHCFAQQFTSVTGIDSDYYIIRGVFMEKEEPVKIVPHHIASN